MALLGKKVAIPIVPGVSPLEDSTELDTLFFTDSDKIRFQNGKLRKVGGWQRIFSNNFQRIKGAARNIFSYTNQTGVPISIIGTSSSLYAVIDGIFYNITPLQSTLVPIANSLSTEYATGTFVMSTIAGSPIVSIYIPNYLNTYDQVTISGVGSAVNGIPAASLNGTFSANVISNIQIEINAGSPALVSGSEAVNFTYATGYLYVNYTNHGLQKGDRVKITGAVDVANIPAAQINVETVVTNVVDPNNFTIQTSTIANAAVSAGGGAGVNIQKQISSGNIDQSDGYGYGGGNYGINAYGVQGQFGSIDTFPRIWSMDVFGDNLILTPGDPLTTTTDNLYIWKNDVTVAPTLLSAEGGLTGTVPKAVRWVYVSHNAVVTLGSDGKRNNYVASDTGSFLKWNIDPSTNAYATTIEQANPFISQGSSRNRDCIFTENEVYLAEFVDKPFIWNFRKLFTTDGLIGPKARTEVEDAIFWMGQGDFFVFDGTSVNVVPNNTVKRYVYDNINAAQSHKVVAFANVEYNEVWWFIPFGNDSEPNNYVKYNYKEGVWDIGTLNRSAAEEPLNIHELPYLIQSTLSKTLTVGNNVRTYFFSPTSGQIPDDPLTFTLGSKDIMITCFADCYLQAGDYIEISNATGAFGIPASEINGIKQIISVSNIAAISGGGYGISPYGAGGYGIGNLSGGYESAIEIQSTSTAAAGSGVGGGNNMTIGTSIIGLMFNSEPGIDANETITVSGVQGVDGIAAQYINGDGITVRHVNMNTVEFASNSADTIFSTSVAYGGGDNAAVSYTPSDRLFMHEVGHDDYNPNYDPINDQPYDQYLAMKAFARTNYAQIGDGDQTMMLYTVYPDAMQTVNTTKPPLPAPAPIIELTVNGKLYPQSQEFTQGPYNITPNTNKIDIMLVARQRQYIIESETLGGDFLIGKWYEEVKPLTTR